MLAHFRFSFYRVQLESEKVEKCIGCKAFGHFCKCNKKLKNVEAKQNTEIKQNIKSGGERNETGLDEFLNALNITRKYALSTCPKKIPSILRRSKRVKGAN